MLKSEKKSGDLTKNNLLYRASWRGIKKCSSCGYINGQRALICRNVNCDLRMKRLAAIKPFDPIQLITYGDTKLYSLRSKEKLLQPRNFVSINEFLDPTESNPRAVCYVENCKYDVFEPTHLVCRHIKACKIPTNVPQAELYPIDKNILWNLNISVEQKQHIWDMYQLEEKQIYPVQKLNSSIFVVKCMESKIFPAGRLHVTVFSNKVRSKNGNFSCSCKKLKIILEADNSVSMKKEICDHLILLLAAILNNPESKILYSKFLNSLQYLWMPTSLDISIVNCESRPSQLVEYDLSLYTSKNTNVKVENVEVSANSDDIFNFMEELFAESCIPDFSDISLEVNKDKISKVQNFCKPEQTLKFERHIKDPKLNATTISLNDDDMELNFPNLNSPSFLTTSAAVITQTSTDYNENSLSVIDQFEINHNIQVSNDNIELAKDIECLNNMESHVKDTNLLTSSFTSKQESLLKTSSNSNNTEELATRSCTIINHTNESKVPQDQISASLKQLPVKIIKISNPLKQLSVKQNGKIIQISKINNKKNIIVLDQHVNAAKEIMNNHNVMQPNRNEIKTTTSLLMPSLSYECWLDHVIEILNESVTIQNSPSVKTIFHVPDAIFNHFSKTLFLNGKQKLTSNATIIKSQKYKDHMKYCWCLNQVSTVQQIFTTKRMKIELERLYQRLADGSFELYIPTTIKLKSNNNFRPIYPKIHLYKAFIQFTNNQKLYANSTESYNCGFKLEWLPSAFPRSNFGLMTIEFCVSVKEIFGSI